MKGYGLGPDGKEVRQLLPGGALLEFGPGRIDGWCVYRTTPEGVSEAPLDREVFRALRGLAGRFGGVRVYGHFARICDHTGKVPEQSMLDGIRVLAERRYFPEAERALEVFSVLYMSMVSEENRAGTMLGRRLKRLGVHQVLLEGRSPEEAARAFDGMGWREIAALCRARGF